MDINNNYYQVYSPPWYSGSNCRPGVFFWREILYKLLFSVWKITLPDAWSLTPFRYYLFCYGSVGVVYTKKLGWIYGSYGVERVDWQYNPLQFNVTNTMLPGPAQGVVGVNGGILRISDSWIGLDPLINYYAELLDFCDRGLKSNLRKVQYGSICGTFSDKDAQSVKAAFAASENGEPIVLVNKHMLNDEGRLDVSQIIGSLKNEYMGEEILESRLMILKDYLTRIGVRTVGMEKREHLLDQEINENNDETGATPYVIKTCLDPGLEILRRLGLSINIEPRYDYTGAGIDIGGANI